MTCVHHWRIDEPEGKTSRGLCRHCGATRQFANGSEDNWGFNEDDPMTGHRKRGPLDTMRTGGKFRWV